MSYYKKYLENRGIVFESPDNLQNKETEEWSGWTDPTTICFIIDKGGNAVVAKKTSHADMQHILWATDESNEEEVFQIYTTLEYLKLLPILDRFSYLKDGESLAKRIMFNMKLAENAEENVRYKLKEFAAGRVFPDVNGVSFWNGNNTLNDAQRHATVDILTKTGHDPQKFIYETGPMEIQMSLDEFLSGGNSKAKKDKDTIIDLEKELHTIADPKVKKMVRDQIKKTKGPSPYYKKKPIPWEWKSLIRQENNNMENFKYYAFDWDDNLLYMPTTILAEDINGNPFEITTSEYSLIRESLPSVVRGEVITGFVEDAYKKFRVNDFFLKEAHSAKIGPAWEDFVEAVNGGKIFSIITARGHSPQTFIDTIKSLIKEGFGGLNYYSCIDSLKEFREYSLSKNVRTEEELFENYINNLCRYYPVSYNVPDMLLESVQDLKVNALHDFITHVDTIFEKFHPEFKNKVSNNFIIGFSDDDRANVRTISETTFQKEVEVYSTFGGIMEKIIS